MRQWTFETFRLHLIANAFGIELNMLTPVQRLLPEGAFRPTSSICLADTLYIEHLYDEIPEKLASLRNSAITRLLDLVDAQNKNHPNDDKTSHEELLQLWLDVEVEFNKLMEEK